VVFGLFEGKQTTGEVVAGCAVSGWATIPAECAVRELQFDKRTLYFQLRAVVGFRSRPVLSDFHFVAIHAIARHVAGAFEIMRGME